ncbi:hypothetical protein CDAR_580201 [Caerostris darwini]|uniref:Uncharacterized protein n=1 Tax=Caerostris darwini TaxID=1538125 RepID=A0AAV4PNS5_9ARAC|nr:hypothetical protein CDAR_580201 [Caerostris darwini]
MTLKLWRNDEETIKKNSDGNRFASSYLHPPYNALNSFFSKWKAGGRQCPTMPRVKVQRPGFLLTSVPNHQIANQMPASHGRCSSHFK